MLRSRSKDAAAARSRPPAASFMTDEQLASYLRDLRHNRPSRPGGARPLPVSNGSSSDGRAARAERALPPRAESALAGPYRHAAQETAEQPDRSASAMSHRRPDPNFTRQDAAGRPLVRQPGPAPPPPRNFSNLTHASNTSGSSGGSGRASCDVPYRYPYYERGQRWMERQEASSLSRALRDMDVVEDGRLHAAAQDEAAELVWKHQNPNVPYQNPDSGYRSHLRQGSHARSQSVGPFVEPDLLVRKGGSAEGSRSASDGSSRSDDTRKVSSGSNGSYGSKSSREDGATVTIVRRGRQLTDSVRERAMAGLPLAISKVRSLSRRRTSDRSSRKTSDKSDKSLFQNPNDQIWEEPETVLEPEESQPRQTDMPLRDRPRNTSYGTVVKALATPAEKPAGPRPSLINIHKNPPSQSRNAGYTRSGHAQAEEPARDLPRDRPDSKDGIEIRGDDIRAATSMRRKDRSPNLPMPSMVSDRPGRPIVSFNNGYKPREIPMREERSKSSPGPAGLGAAPVPTIDIAEAPSIQVNSVPSISVSGCDEPSPSIPVISIGDSEPQRPSGSAPKGYGVDRARPRISQQRQHGTGSTPHWSPSAWPVRNQAQCANCALGISGKVVTAAGQRFHPQCFTCHQCGEHLECVAFYPEPERVRGERVARIEARLHGDFAAEDQAAELEDGDAGLRFYCHLDFHEKFSPRCRSCKTPIEGKVVVACGGEWHEGHFFCAECGDPFDQTTPFVEKDGYAWCVGCHTKRFSGKCAGCRKPIVDTVINALDREWHEHCFTCDECGGEFADGQFFTREDGGMPVCVRCEERRLKA